MDNLKIIGQRIRHYRKMQALTQKDLAEELGVASSYIANIEQAQKGITVNRLIDICRSLNISLSDLFPIQSKCDTEFKEEMIEEIAEILRALETPQVQLFKTMLTGAAVKNSQYKA